MLIEKAEIETLIPHSGSMSLLDGVEHWDSLSIRCVSTSHQQPDNPMQFQGQLDSVVLVEYGAQAAAVHSAIIHRAENNKGINAKTTAYIGAVKDVVFARRRIDSNLSAITVEAHCVLNNLSGAIYTIECRHQDQKLLSARVVLVLPTE